MALESNYHTHKPENSWNIIGYFNTGIAIKALLRGAREAKVHHPRYIKYVKPGRFEDAYRDFISVKPTDVRRVQFDKKVNYLNHNVRKRTSWYIRTTKTQISLRIHAVLSETSLSACRNFA